MDEGSAPKPRINGSMLAQYQGRPVCVLGLATSVDRNGLSFQLTSSDNQNIVVHLQEPLQELVHGLVEVHGSVTGSSEVTCYDYILFSDEMSQTFDMESYNKAITMMQKFAEWPVANQWWGSKLELLLFAQIIL